MAAEKASPKVDVGSLKGSGEGVGETSDLVSVIIPVHNAAEYLNDTFASVIEQTYTGPIQVTV